VDEAIDQQEALGIGGGRIEPLHELPALAGRPTKLTVVDADRPAAALPRTGGVLRTKAPAARSMTTRR
jgi:hypothetical protein